MGVVCLDILLDRVRDYAVNTFFTQGGYGLLVNRKIEVLAHPDKHMWGRALRDVNSGYVSLADGLEQGVPVIERRMKNYKNEASVVSFRHFKNGWHIGMVILEKEYFKEMRKMRLILIAVGIVLSALFSAILLRLSAARKELQYISESKSSFLASMSHEIRTPMNAITGMAELLLRRDLPDEARNDIRDIKQAGHNLISIINDILDLSKIEAGKLEIIPVEYLLASLIKDTVNIVRMRLEEKPILFYADIDSNIPNSLIGDEVRLRQIMLNLLSNAVKYTEKGHISLTITAEERDSEQVRLKITVADTGKGIKPEDAKKLFGNFVQVDTKKNRGIEGTGLGLAITKRLCDAMGGDISVESEYGKGSVFTVSIPQGINPTESFATVDTKSFIEKAGEVRFTIPHARLLIVDDIAINLKVAEGLLSPYNAIVDTCPGGAEAVEMVKRNRYDLVFMDHMMPEVDGIEATAAIREWEALTMSSEQLAGGKIAESSEKRVMRSAVPIIALTANAVVGMKETFIEKGFNDFLSKPIDTSMLDEIIDRWIPEEKKNKNSQTPSSHCSLLTAHCSLSDIPGIDIKRGIAMLGGKEQMYRKLLALFCADAEQRIAILKDSVEDIAAVAKQAHAFRGVTANLGAAEISAEAAQLEAACKAGDINRMKLNMDGFIKHLTELVNNISLAIK
jgi:signal transduction histidine kinase/DNA-binding response OmpR family regulator/HPt (histidine-containing phosphotransfer) domain-containing protein